MFLLTSREYFNTYIPILNLKKIIKILKCKNLLYKIFSLLFSDENFVLFFHEALGSISDTIYQWWQ